MADDYEGPIRSLADMPVAPELARRATRAPDYASEARGLRELAGELALRPGTALQKLADAIMSLCGADSAGISIAPAHGADRRFHWPAVSGEWAVAPAMPTDATLFAPEIGRDMPLLFDRPDRFFPAAARVHDMLLLPVTLDEGRVGGLWAVAHHPGRRFDREDARLLGGLTGFAAVACRLGATRNEAGRATRLAGVAQDITARRGAEDRIREGEQRFRMLSEGLPQIVWRAGDHGWWTRGSPQWCMFTGQSEPDSHGWGWIEMIHPDDRAVARAAWERARSTDSFEADYRVYHAADDRYRWFTTRAAAVRDEHGRLVEWLGTSTDVDDLRRLQAHQERLLGELQHRVRNSLAVIRSIARRTAAASETVEDFSLHLDGRLASFARTQTAATRFPTLGLDLRMIVSDELLAHLAREGEQAHISGPVVRLQPKAAETLALAFHELATNAVKFGALSVPDGAIRLSWRIAPDGDGLERLTILWDESRPGPPLARPEHRGFGTELIAVSLKYELEAETALQFRPGGLLCTISLPPAKTIVGPNDVSTLAP